MEESFKPILTRRSRILTPNLGKLRKDLPTKISEVAQSNHGLDTLKVEPVKEQIVDFNDAL